MVEILCKWIDLPPVITPIDAGHVRVEYYATGVDGRPELSWKCVMPRSVFVASLTTSQNVDETMRKADAKAYIDSLPRNEDRHIA